MAAPRSRARRIVPWAAGALIWVTAVALGASLGWAAPPTGEADRLSERLASLRAEAGDLHAATASMEEKVDALRDELAASERRGRDLSATISRNDATIARLHEQIAARREAIAAAAAAAAAAEAAASPPTSSESSSSSTVAPPAPAPNPPVCFVGPGGRECT